MSISPLNLTPYNSTWTWPCHGEKNRNGSLPKLAVEFFCLFVLIELASLCMTFKHPFLFVSRLARKVNQNKPKNIGINNKFAQGPYKNSKLDLIAGLLILSTFSLQNNYVNTVKN